MLIILEGIDGAGKTTLANEIAELVDGNTLHGGEPTMPGLLNYTLPIHRHGDKRMICDRWHLSENVYGPLLRGGSCLAPVEYEAVEYFLYARHALLVLCNTDHATCVSRIHERGEDVDELALRRAKRAFEDAYIGSKLPKLLRGKATAQDIVTTYTTLYGGAA